MFISRKKYNEIVEAGKKLAALNEEMQKFPYLVGIEREGRMNKFTFARNKEMYTIETMGLIGDNLPEWKERLLR